MSDTETLFMHLVETYGLPEPRRQVSISGEDFWLSADGEISGPERRRSWHVEPAAYSMLLPRTGRA